MRNELKPPMTVTVNLIDIFRLFKRMLKRKKKQERKEEIFLVKEKQSE